jgi:hypothetical protein
MNSTIYLTDIFGTVIDSSEQHEIPFLLVHCYTPELILINVFKNNFSIYKPNKNYIRNILQRHRINSVNFCTLGDIWLPNDKYPPKITILLANNNFTLAKYPINYRIVEQLDDIYIWEPICNKNYVSLGLIASIEKPLVNEVLTINKKYVTEYNGHIHSSELTNMNEFNMLATLEDFKYTIKRSALIKYEDDIEIRSKINGKILGEKNNGYNVGNNNIPISHTIQGELKIGNNCLSIDTNNNIVQKKCNNMTQNKWYFYDDNIVSDYNHNCLSVDDNNSIIGEPCKPSKKNQKWDIKSKNNVIIDNLQETNDKWTTIKGKNVVLLESDNPWYLNKTGQIEGIVKPQTIELNQVEYESAAQYKPNFMIDPIPPDMGHGHSYVERNGGKYFDDCFRDDEKIEMFVDTKTKVSNIGSIILCILAILFVIVTIKYYF